MTFTPSAATTRLLTDKFSGTGNPLVDWSAVWNSGGTTFTGIRFDVTDTASAAGSLLMDLRVGGASKANINKSGVLSILSINGISGEYSEIRISTNFAGNDPSVTAGGTGAQGVSVRSQGAYAWTSSATTSEFTSRDLFLVRDAADTLAQRRGVNAQAFRIYGTYTDASNFERLSLSAAPGGYIINTQVLGTGVVKTLSIRGNTLYLGGTQNNDNWQVNVSGHFGGTTDNAFDIGATAANRPRNLFLGSYMQLSEMTAPAAPAANNVVIYAEDNGAGKTRLMARFATGAAQQIAIEP